MELQLAEKLKALCINDDSCTAAILTAEFSDCIDYLEIESFQLGMYLTSCSKFFVILKYVVNLT